MVYIMPKELRKKNEDGKEPLTDDLIAVFIIGMTYLLIYVGTDLPLIAKLGFMAAVSWVFGLKSIGKFGKYISK